MSLPDRLPHDLDAERALLGALVVDPSYALWQILELVRPSDLYAPEHRLILEVARDIATNGSGAPDVVTLTHHLSDRGVLQRVGGATYLEQLASALPDVANIAGYADIVVEMARRRRLVEVTQRAQTAALAGGVEAAEVERDLLAALASHDTRRVEAAWLEDAMRTEAARVVKLHREGAGALGLLTGLRNLDDVLGGLKNEYYLVAGRPGSGKSVLLDQIATNAARLTSQHVLVAITEMGVPQRARRQLSAATGIPLPRLSSGRLTPTEAATLERLEASPGRVRYVQVAGRTASEVRTLVLRDIAQHGRPSLVVLDYIGQLRDQNPRQTMSERMGEKSAVLRDLAAVENIPVVVAAQLSREVEKEKRPPRLSDLRESGSLEADAYSVVMLHRVEADRLDLVAAIIAKHRDGATASVPLRFDPGHMRFVDGPTREPSAWPDRRTA